MAETKREEIEAVREKPYVVEQPRRRPWAAAALVAAGVAGAGLTAWPAIQGQEAPPPETSKAQAWQEEDADGSFGKLDMTPEPAVMTEPLDDGPSQDDLNAQREDLERRNAELTDEMAALRAQLAELAERPPADDGAALAEAVSAMQAQNAELVAQLQAEFDNRLRGAELEAEQRLARERARRESEVAAAEAERLRREQETQAATMRLEALSRQVIAVEEENRDLRGRLEGGMDDMARARAEADRQAAAEAERRAQLEARRAEAQALASAQVRSDGVVFDAGGGTPGLSEAGQGAPAPGDAAGRAFVAGLAEAAPVARAKAIANPARTVLQGTVIEATLETAIDTGLPGPVTAVVTRPVHGFDHSRVLIPAGSRLFGAYSADVSLGQRRALVGWSRIVTPDGQSVTLAGFGADAQGRSGLTGRVDTRFGQRFGSAALLSVIGAAPALAAAEAGGGIEGEVAEDIGANFERTTRGAIGAYATLPPVVTVEPGAAIAVIVDRDLELL